LFIFKAKVESSSVLFSEATEVATVQFDKALEIGAGKLHIKYTGKLNENLKGFYRSKYTVAGETRFAAVTQFEVYLLFY
jgi:puromycin-sensitive aminopeptidase